jgi:hypothetical protein
VSAADELFMVTKGSYTVIMDGAEIADLYAG